MPLVDKTYFVGELNISTSNAAVLERLNLFIAKYEEEFLKKIFGTVLYNSYTEGIAVDPPDQILIDLRDGKEYEANSDSYKWFGLVNDTTKQSPIANYIYYWWMRSDTSAKPDDAEAQMAYYDQRARSMARAWNEMSEWITGPHTGYLYSAGLVGFLKANNLIYGWTDLTGFKVYREFAPINTMNV